MKLHMTEKLRSLLLIGVLSLSLLFGGCSNNIKGITSVIGSNSSQESNDNSSNSVVPSDSQEASIERVVDGDTMKVKLKDTGETVTLRLLLMDTPESVKPGVDPQPYSLDASNFAKEVLKAGDSVYLEYDEGNKTDKYDRHLCYLWYYSEEDNGWKMFNEKMVEKGLARVGYIYSQKRHLDTLYAAQDKAKKSKLNIWSVDGYVTDKGFDVDVYNSGKSASNNNVSSSTLTGNSNENTSKEIVYANGGTSSSNKYHESEHAHGMKGAIKMTESEAKAQGYEACGLCYK